MKKFITIIIIVGLVLGVGIPMLLTAPAQQPPQPKTGAILYIFGTETCGWCQKQKTKSTTVVDKIVFVEINEELSGTKENFDDFFKLADIVTDNHRETAGTPINVLAMDNKYALWMGYVSPEEIAKIQEQLSSAGASLYLPTATNTFSQMSQEQYELVDDVIKRH